MSLDLEEIIETFCAALRRGVTPDIDAFANRYPAHRDTLLRLLPTLLAMDTFAQTETGLPQTIELPLPMMLGAEFRLERTLGQGGMGTVFEAVQLPLERRCAVKLLSRHLAAERRHREAFIREARVMASLHHPHIVKVFSAGETSEYAYYAMEYVRGKSLDLLSLNGPRELANYALQTAQALAYAHQCGIIHCDIKPANLLIDDMGQLLIADFGLARVNGPSMAKNELVYSGGTRAYLAPECGDAHTFTPHSDQYSLGITYQELAHRHGIPLPPDLEAIFKVCTASAPTQRYASLEDVATDLRHFLAGEPVSVRPMTWRRKITHWTRRHPISSTAAALLILGLPLFTGLLAYSHQQTRQALAAAEHHLSVADTTLACTFEHIGRNTPSHQAAVLLDVLMPYYQDTLQRLNAPPERFAEAESIVATIALRTGDYDTAIAAFRRQMDVSPSLKTANQLAEALALSSDSASAIARYQQNLKLPFEETFEHQLERLRAQCELDRLQQTKPSTATIEELQALKQASPHSTEVEHLYLTAQARLPQQADLQIEHARIQLAESAPQSPHYGIAAVQTMTARLESNTPLTREMETLLTATRKIAQRLLGQWPDDPQILLTTVQFSVADRKRIRHDPRLTAQAHRATERLSGALEVLFLGSSLPEDTRDPLFNTLFTNLLNHRHQNERKQAARFRRRIKEQLPPPRTPRRSSRHAPKSITNEPPLHGDD